MPVGDASPPADDPLVGLVLSDRYRIVRKIGEGGMGCVYQAEHALIEKRLALKILFQDFTRRPDLVARFLQEAKSASRIGHENVIDISDFGQSPDGLVYIAMELLEGQDLGRVLRTGNAMPWSRARPILMQIAKALRAAHEKGVIHRDMKPENVYLVQREGRPDFVKVLDFGIAKIVNPDENDGPRLTQTGMIFGTPEYMSPEQAQGHPPDHRVDVYAVGCIMYHLLTGSVPFTAESFMGILTKHLLEPPVPPRTRRPDLDIAADVEAICLRAMEKDRDKRWPDMNAFYQALGAADGFQFEPSNVYVDRKGRIDHAPLAGPDKAVNASRGAIAAPPAAAFDDQRPGRPEVTGAGAAGGGKAKILAAAGALIVAGAVVAFALRSPKPSPSVTAVPAGPAPSAVVPAAKPATAPAPSVSPPSVAAPAPPAPAGAEAAAPAADTQGGKGSRSRRRRVEARGETGEPQPDPLRRKIPLPDETPAELKNPFSTP